MCGIAGEIRFNEQVQAPAAQLMLDQLHHRGPDHSELWLHKNVALGHTRLSILDLNQRSNQPFVTKDQQGVVIYNGELYNYLELRSDLEQEGLAFQTQSDTEVVLQAMHHWGVETAIPMFNGMFSLAYLDQRCDTLWLVRDRLGIKPLFVAHHAGGIAFASEQKALKAHPDVSHAVDPQAILALLTYERFDNIETPHQDIELFPPGQIWSIHDGEIYKQTFFDAMATCKPKQIAQPDKTFNEQAQHFEQELKASVTRHLISDVPVAALCSGGLDSGLVTTFAAQANPNLHAYVADMVGMQGEEHRRAQLITDHLGIKLTRVDVTPESFLRHLPHAVLANDQPLFFAQEVALLLISKQMHADGIKVCLSGDGADELFGGYTWYSDIYRKWEKLALKAKLLPPNKLTHALGRKVSRLKPVNLEREIEQFATTRTLFDYVATSFNSIATAGMQRTLRQRDLFNHFAALPLPERAMLARNIEDVYIHMRESLNCKDKMLMHYSIEGRPPFMDKHLIELGLNLPVDHKMRGNQRKRLIQYVAERHLPKSILNLPKIGFTAPPVLWRNAAKGMLANGRVAEFLKWPVKRQDDIYALLNSKPYYLFRLLGCEVWMRLQSCDADADEIGEQLVHYSAQK